MTRRRFDAVMTRYYMVVCPLELVSLDIFNHRDGNNKYSILHEAIQNLADTLTIMKQNDYNSWPQAQIYVQFEATTFPSGG